VHSGAAATSCGAAGVVPGEEPIESPCAGRDGSVALWLTARSLECVGQQGRWVSGCGQNSDRLTFIAVCSGTALAASPGPQPTVDRAPAAGTATVCQSLVAICSNSPAWRNSCPVFWREMKKGGPPRRYEVLDLRTGAGVWTTLRPWPGSARTAQLSRATSSCSGGFVPLHRALLNLFGNACGATPGQGVGEVRFAGCETSVGSGDPRPRVACFNDDDLERMFLALLSRRSSRVAPTGRARPWFGDRASRSGSPRGTGARAQHPGGGRVMELVLPKGSRGRVRRASRRFPAAGHQPAQASKRLGFELVSRSSGPVGGRLSRRRLEHFGGGRQP